MATIKLKKFTTNDTPPSSLTHGELGVTQNLLWYANSSGANIRVARYSELTDYLPLAGGTLTAAGANYTFSNSGATAHVWKGWGGITGDNDDWVIRGSQTATNAGYLEIAVGDDGTEPIYVSQYGVSGAVSSRSSNMSSSNRRTIALLDNSGNTIIPGTFSFGNQTGTTKNATIQYNSSTQSIDFIFN